MNYRKRPIEVEALQLFQSDFDFAFSEKKKKKENRNITGFYHKFLGGDVWLSENREGKIKAKIRTLEGAMEIEDGDWLIKGIKGEFYPCKPDIFETTYEAILPSQLNI